MRKILLKTTSDPYLFQWMDLPVLGVQTNSPREFGTLSELSEEVKGSDEATYIIFLAPATAVQVRQLSFLPAERKHLAKTVPYTLEEEMISDASELHCVMSKPAANTLWVAALQKSTLNAWIKLFADAQLKVRECIPEQVILLNHNAPWSMYYDNGEFLMRSDDAQIHGVDSANIGLALELATDNFKQLPENIELTLNEQADAEDALAQLPEILHERISTRINPLPLLFNEHLSQARELNLLCGEFGQGLNWRAELKKWRAVLWMLLAGLIVHAGVAYAEYKKSDAELRDIRAQVVSLHKRVFPAGKLTNSRRALEGELKRLRGGASAQFLPLLELTSNILKKHQDYTVNSITFSASRGSLELELLLKDHSDVEKFKSELSAAELSAELLSSVGEGDKVKARILISGAS